MYYQKWLWFDIIVGFFAFYLPVLLLFPIYFLAGMVWGKLSQWGYVDIGEVWKASNYVSLIFPSIIRIVLVLLCFQHLAKRTIFQQKEEKIKKMYLSFEN